MLWLLQRGRKLRPAAASSGVDLGLRQEQALTEIGRMHLRAPEIGSGQIGQSEIRIAQVCADEPGTAKARADEQDGTKARAREIGSAVVRPRARNLRTRQLARARQQRIDLSPVLVDRQVKKCAGRQIRHCLGLFQNSPKIGVHSASRG